MGIISQDRRFHLQFFSRNSFPILHRSIEVRVVHSPISICVGRRVSGVSTTRDAMQSLGSHIAASKHI